MLTIIIRAILIYLIVLLVFRLMGKRQIGQMQPFELVLTLIIADLATIPMAEISVPVLHGIVPLLTLVLLHFILTLISRKSLKVAKVLSGKPIIIINPKGIDYNAMKKLNLSIEDLFEMLRGCGYFDISQIEYAIMETNGKVSVLPKSEFTPVNNKDIKNKVERTLLPLILINEGVVINSNLKQLNITIENIKEVIRKKINLKDIKIKDILIFIVNEKGKGYFQMKNSEGINFETKLQVAG